MERNEDTEENSRGIVDDVGAMDSGTWSSKSKIVEVLNCWFGEVLFFGGAVAIKDGSSNLTRRSDCVGLVGRELGPPRST